MAHVVLLGDSIFDNARYVPDRPPVIEQVKRSLPAGWKATLLAVDGHVASDVSLQLARLPPDATHLFVSVGGNDALGEIGMLQAPAGTVADALALFGETQAQFRAVYQEMLRAVMKVGKPTAICTVYDFVPSLGQVECTALGLFNDIIIRAAFLAGVPLIDLRLICTEASDYSPLSPIEPSVTGGAKIARMITRVATDHDFSRQQCVVYA